jgi:hypothetical protein
MTTESLSTDGLAHLHDVMTGHAGTSAGGRRLLDRGRGRHHRLTLR